MQRFIFILCILFLPLIGLCLEEKESLGNRKVTFRLPINWATAPQYTLNVVIPEGYVPLQAFDTWENVSLVEFVPKGQTGDNWSEIISVNKFINQKVDAINFVQQLKYEMLKKVDAGSHTLQEETKTFDQYHFAKIILSYKLQGEREIMGAIYLSGPYDCVGVQYTIRPNDQQSEQEALSKIEKFFENSVNIQAVETNKKS